MMTTYRLTLKFKGDYDYIKQLHAIHEIEKNAGIKLYSVDDEPGTFAVMNDAPMLYDLFKLMTALKNHGLRAEVTSSAIYEI